MLTLQSSRFTFDLSATAIELNQYQEVGNGSGTYNLTTFETKQYRVEISEE